MKYAILILFINLVVTQKLFLELIADNFDKPVYVISESNNSGFPESMQGELSKYP